MPIIDVQMVMQEGTLERDKLAQELADALGVCLGAAAGRVWVRVHVLPASRYAENGAVLSAAELPVFVCVLHARLPESAALKEQAQRIARAVAVACGRAAGRVHVEFAPAGAGRIAFGGELIE